MVLNTNDSGSGSLRQVIIDAANGDTITFTNTLNDQTIVLTNGQITLNQDVVIDGSSLSSIVLDGNESGRIFEVGSNSTVVIDSLTMTNGDGGGQFTTGSTSGGGIYNYGTLTIKNSTLSGNCGYHGGGINNHDGTLTIENSTISGNTADGMNAAGGGIHSLRGTLMIKNSSISGNSADNGGGMREYGCTLTIENSTISGNSARGGYGGGIYSQYDRLVIKNSTISGNSANGHSGGIQFYDSVPTLTLEHSIIAGNTAPTNPNSNRSLPSDENNLIDGDPQLAPLGNYGGSTQTMPPLPGSPVIDAGGTTTLTNDQRGLARVVNGTVDIGAVEIQDASDMDSIIVTVWSTDVDNDGNAFGVEYALGTDWSTTDRTNSANLAALAAGGAAFGLNTNALNITAWVLKRSLDLLTDSFTEIYRYDGPTDSTTTYIPVLVKKTASGIEVYDLSGVTNAYYQLGAEVSPYRLITPVSIQISGSWEMVNYIDDGPFISDITVSQNGTNIVVILEGSDFTGYIAGTNLYFSGSGESIGTMEFEGSIQSSTYMSGKGFDIENGQRTGSGWDWTATKQ